MKAFYMDFRSRLAYNRVSIVIYSFSQTVILNGCGVRAKRHPFYSSRRFFVRGYFNRLSSRSFLPFFLSLPFSYVVLNSGIVCRVLVVVF